MHLYNAWLPPPVAEETKMEKESFAAVVRSVKEAWRPEDPDSVYSTLKWISVIQLYIKAKSDVSLADVEVLVEVGLDVFNTSQNKLYAQVRWGNILVRILKKFGKKLSLKVQWRPFYDMLMRTHFKRHTFILSNEEKQWIWTSIEQLLLDNQVEIREQAAGVLASLMKGGDADLAMSFRHRALKEGQSIDIRRKQRTWRSSHSIVSLHGAVLALVASVLSVPYDMPRPKTYWLDL